jgi:hypothetical protein
LKFVFAGALHNLGLKNEAITLLEETLATDREISEYWMRAFHALLDMWKGFTAKSEEEVLTFDGRILRGPIVAVLDGDERGEVIGGAMALPVERMMNFDTFSATIKCIGFQQGFANEQASPHPLGCFIVRDLDPERLPKEPMKFLVRVNEDLRIEGTACQGERRLPVEWSLYPVPVFENRTGGNDEEGR